MDNRSFFLYLLVMAGSTYLIRAIPFALMRKKIKNTFIRSFLYYIPYAVLSAMTFPSALYATGSVISAAIGLGAAILVSFKSKSLTLVAITACLTVFLTECVMSLI
ncbi:MAG: AzlD domain-containing protein [Clostridia bacterium]|nr:AzlD domain-containing protein [Clostridia bacterium]